MYELFRNLGARRALGAQLPLIVASGAIAEVFYKFHSFTLECGAFLATWFVLDLAAQAIGRRRLERRAPIA